VIVGPQRYEDRAPVCRPGSRILLVRRCYVSVYNAASEVVTEDWTGCCFSIDQMDQTKSASLIWTSDATCREKKLPVSPRYYLTRSGHRPRRSISRTSRML